MADHPTISTESNLASPALPTTTVTRRSLLGSAGIAAGAAVLASPPSMLGTTAASAQPVSTDPRPLDAAFKRRAFDIREECARNNDKIPIAPHPTNGDEARYTNKIGSDSRGLPHDKRGEVEQVAWQALYAACQSGDPADFEKVPLGGTRKLINPIGTQAVSLTGMNPTQIAIPSAPALASAERGGEAVEVYWQSLLRDVPLTELRDDTSNRDVLAATEELNKLADFRGPKSGGRVTPGTLFRANALYFDPTDPKGRSVTPPGVLDGPLVSQFLLRDVPYAPQWISAQIRTVLPANDFLTDYDEWLATQNGAAAKRRLQFDATPRYIATGRDLAEYVRAGPALGWAAAQMLATPGGGTDQRYSGMYPLAEPVSYPSNPYRKSKTQGPAGATFGLAHVQALLTTGISNSVRASYWQKYFVHRSVRPEAYGGLAHHRLANGVSDYPLHDSFLKSEALDRSKAKSGTYLLSQTYPDGAPFHSTYPGGATGVGAVTATILKAFFDESRVIANPVQPDPADPTRLVPYTGPPLTVGGELNKLAVNYGFGRNWAGIHWRSDASASMAIGEEVAIGMLRDERMTLREPFDGFSFTRFDGSRVTI
ncbi:vanadium-dependent haloperoxidase [Bradyrhizobium cajani]|uniref:Twin-arginine translocation pathway signal protein n=1 Tax=Bradyrhizobium cajani TaxID=1928661 RepID=A0A844TNZ9_9BRAD|nr:vanadium-dependent haloperoxidase [Bradyrhizobium cajani]MCP3369070.1 vanadium-dependent haloperoxidase [Bradyrhizobium cajani]MVT77554.1 twin-arginine translocation pathway signal protein [Bradyrhizobium cajani]